MADSIDAVLFDLDDTLCRYRRTSGDLLADSFDAVGVDPFFDEAAYYDEYERIVDDDDHDSMRELRERCFANLADEHGYSRALAQAMADHYAESRDHTNVEPLPGARSAVASLAADHDLAVVTNGAPEMQSKKLSALAFTEHFQTVVYAGYDTPAKPEPDAYHVALDALDVTPDRAVHVGNSLHSDVQGAHNAGVHSTWLAADDATLSADATTPTPDYTISKLDALATPPWQR
jgi:HAD superfamily hydrolase (TIGR01509 family)